MNPDTVLGCLLGALAMFIRRQSSRAAQGLWLAVILVGAISVAEWHLDVDLMLDEALVLSVGSTEPGRMVPITAYSFMLLGAAALLIIGGRVLAGQVLAILPAR
jgi:hypothetical protein